MSEFRAISHASTKIFQKKSNHILQVMTIVHAH